MISLPNQVTALTSITKNENSYTIEIGGGTEESDISGLGFQHRFPKAGIDGMDVFEGCLFLFVSENFLQVSYGHPIIDIMRAEGMPEGMYSGFSHPGLFIILFDQFPDTAWI